MHPAHGGTGVDRSLLVLVDIVEHQRRVEVLADIVGALLAVLPAPCGVIQMVAAEVDGLLDCSFAVGILAGVHPEGGGKRMVLVELLLAREEEAAGGVERSGHHTLVGIAEHSRCRKSQPLFVHAGGIGGHGAVLIVGVGVAESTVEAGGVALGDGTEVLAAADVAESVGCSRQAHGSRGVAECARGHAGQLLEGESSAHEVVHGQRVDVCIAPHVVVAAVVGIERRVAVAAEAEIDVVVGTGKSTYGLRVAGLVLHHRFVEEKLLAVLGDEVIVGEIGEQTQSAGIDALAVVETRLRGTPLVAGSHDGEHGFAGTCVTDAEIAGRACGDGNPLVLNRDNGARNGASRIGVDDATGHHRRLSSG